MDHKIYMSEVYISILLTPKHIQPIIWIDSGHIIVKFKILDYLKKKKLGGLAPYGVLHLGPAEG